MGADNAAAPADRFLPRFQSLQQRDCLLRETVVGAEDLEQQPKAGFRLQARLGDLSQCHEDGG